MVWNYEIHPKTICFYQIFLLMRLPKNWHNNNNAEIEPFSLPVLNAFELFYALKSSVILRWNIPTPMSLKNQVPPFSIHFGHWREGEKEDSSP